MALTLPFVTLKKQVDVASILFQELVLNYPDRNDLFIEYYETLKMQQNGPEAKQMLIEHVEQFGYNPQIVSRLQVHYWEKAFEETLEVLAKGEAYLEDEELPLGFLFIAGNALTSLKRYDEAQAVFIQATKQAPDLIDTHLALFSTLVTKGDTAGSKLLLLELFEQYGMIPDYCSSVPPQSIG